MKFQEIFENAYRGEHEAPDHETGAPLFDVTKNGIYPEDFYTSNGFLYYAENDGPGANQSYRIICSYRNKPNTLIKVYRAIPKDLPKTIINTGDWVAISRAYTTDHGKSNLKNNFRIISKTVFARDLFTDGSVCEWGYDPQPRDTSFDAERKRRRLLIAQLPDEKRIKFHQQRKLQPTTMDIDSWNKFYYSILEN